MSNAEPRHRRHEWSAVREYRTPDVPPRHADSIVTRLGAAVFDMDGFRQLLAEVGSGNPFKAHR